MAIIKDLDTQHGYKVLVQTTLELHKTYDICIFAYLSAFSSKRFVLICKIATFRTRKDQDVEIVCLKSISVETCSKVRIPLVIGSNILGVLFCGIRNPKKDLEEKTWSQICMQLFLKSGSLSTLFFGRLVNLRSCWFQLRLHFMYYKCIISDGEMVFLWCSMGDC